MFRFLWWWEGIQVIGFQSWRCGQKNTDIWMMTLKMKIFVYVRWTDGRALKSELCGYADLLCPKCPRWAAFCPGYWGSLLKTKVVSLYYPFYCVLCSHFSKFSSYQPILSPWAQILTTFPGYILQVRTLILILKIRTSGNPSLCRLYANIKLGCLDVPTKFHG